MSHRETCSEEPNVGADNEEFTRLLKEALNLADQIQLPPELGARLQEVIDMAENCSRPAVG